MSTNNIADGNSTAAAEGNASSGMSELHKIIKVFTNRHTCQLYERHVQAVDSISRRYKDGFYVSDLPQVQRILSLACDSLLLGHNEFVEPVCGVLRACSEPFLEAKSNEMFRSVDTVCDTIVVIASLMISAPARICMAAANTLQRIFEMKDFRDAADTPAAVGVHTDSNPDDLRPNMWFFHQQVVDRSGVIKIVVAALRKLIKEVEDQRVEFQPEVSVEPDETVWDAADRLKPSEQEKDRLLHLEVLRCTISLVRELSFSKENAKTLVKEGVPLICVSTLAAGSDYKEPIVANCIDIIWNLLETSSNALASEANVSRSRSKLVEKHRSTNCMRVLGIKKTFDVLRGVFEQTLVGGFRAKDKELRNNVLVVASMLARHRQNHQFFISSGFLDSLLLYSTAPEIGLPTPAEEHNYGTPSEHDFELKRLMWQLISDIAMHRKGEPVGPTTARAHTAISQMPLAETLLMYMDTSRVDERALSIWAVPQLRVLRIDACGLLGVLLHVAKCAEQFVALDGPRVVLNFLQSVTGSPISNGNGLGDSFNGSSANMQSTVTLGTVASKEATLLRSAVHDTEMELAAVRLLSHSSSQPEASIVSSLGQNGGVMTMLNLFQADLGDDLGAIELRTQTVNALGNLCDPRGGSADGKIDPEREAACRMNQDVLRREGGILVLKDALVYDPLMPASAEVLLMMVIDTMWRSVIGNRKSEVRFIDNDGVDALLDLVEQVPAAMHRQIMGALADLCQNRRAQSYYRAWRSSTSMQGASTILLRMWSAEELRLRVRNGERGMVANLDAPLKGDLRPTVRPPPAPQRSDSAGSYGIEDDEEGDPDLDEGEDVPGKLDRTGEPTLEEELGGLTGEAKRSKLYKRLQRALATAKDITIFSQKNDPGAEFRIAAEAKDLRMLVWAVFESVGWENLGLENDDMCDDIVLVALKCCKNYREFMLGESWNMVRTELRDLNIYPIKPDALLMETALENAYNAAMETKYEQSNLVEAIKDQDMEKERSFYDNILRQQEQEVQAHLAAARGANPPARKKGLRK